MTIPSTTLAALREVFERRVYKGLDSWPVPDYRAGNCRDVAEALAELAAFRETFSVERLEGEK